MKIFWVFILSFCIKLSIFFPSTLYAHELNRTDTAAAHTSRNLPGAVEHFCGERIPMHDPLVKNRMEAEINRRVSYRKESILFIKRAYRYELIFKEILRDEGIPEDFFYLSIAESGLSNAISPRGAGGFWQFMERTAMEYGLEVSETVDERFHPEKATRAACKYFIEAYRYFQNWSLTAASYNLGIHRLKSAVRIQQPSDVYQLQLNKESDQYLYRILSIKYLLTSPDNLGYSIYNYEKHQPISYRSIYVNEDVEDLNRFAASYRMSIEMLKLMNPWLISDKLIVKPGKTYEIRIPLERSVYAEELHITAPFGLGSSNSNYSSMLSRNE